MGYSKQELDPTNKSYFPEKKIVILHPCLPTSRPLSSVPKVAVVERFDCTEFDSHGTISIKRINVSTGCNPVS